MTKKNKPHLSDEELTERISDDASKCPWCQGDAIDVVCVDNGFEDDSMIQRMECGTCESSWTEIYTFRAATEFRAGSSKKE